MCIKVLLVFIQKLLKKEVHLFITQTPNKLLMFAAKNAAGLLLAGFANNTRNRSLARRYV